MRLALISKTSSSLLVTVAGVAGAFLFDVLMARVLSSNDFGLVRAYMSALMMLSSFMALGAGQAIIRAYAISIDKTEAHGVPQELAAHQYKGIALIFGALGIPCAYAFVSALSYDTQVTTLLIGTVVLSTIRATYIVDRAALIAESRVWTAQLTDRVVMFPIAIGCLYIAVFAGFATAETALGCYGVGLAVSCLLAYKVASRSHRQRSDVATPSSFSAIVASAFRSLPFMWEDVVNMALRHLSIVVVAFCGNPTQAAVFAIAMRIADLLLLAQASGNIAAAPMLARAYSQGDYNAIRVASSFISSLYFLCAILLCALIYFGSDGISLVFGSGFAGAAPLAIAVVTGRALAAFWGLPGQVMLMAGRAKANALIAVGSALAMLFTMLISISWYPAWSGALGSVVGIVASSVAGAIYCRRALAIDLFWLKPSMLRELFSPSFSRVVE